MTNTQLEKPLSFFQQTAKTAYGIIHSASEWMWNQLPSFSLMSSPIIQKENLEKAVDEELEKNDEEANEISFVKSIVNTAWRLASYAKENPSQTFALALTIYYAITNNFSFSQTTSENSEHLMNGIRVATNTLASATDTLAKLAVMQFATRGSNNSPLNIMLTGLSCWSRVAATTPEFFITNRNVDERVAALVDLKNMSFVVVYNDYMKFFNSTTSENFGLDIRVSTVNPGFRPRAATSQNGDFIVTWTTTTEQVYLQRFNINWEKLGVETQLATDSEYSYVATSSNGNYMVVWGSDDGWYTYAQCFNTMHVQLGAAFILNTLPASLPAVVSLSNGGFMVSWVSFDSDHYNIYAQRLDAMCIKVGTAFRVDTVNLDNLTTPPAIAPLPNSDCMIIWGDSFDPIQVLYGRLFNATNIQLESQFNVNVLLPTGNRIPLRSWSPFLTNCPDGSLVLVWDSNKNDPTWDDYIYGVRLNSTGFPIGNVFQISAYHAGNSPSVICFEDGSFVVVSDYHHPLGIYGRIFTPPRLENNNLVINIGQTKLLTNSELSASALRTDPGTLIFTPINVTHGNFKLVSNPNLTIFNFTQQQVIDGQIQFVHDGSVFPPSYYIRVNEVVLDTTPSAANIIFTILNPTPTPTPTAPPLNTATATPTPLPADPTATPTPTSTPILSADPTATATPTSTPIIPAVPTATATPTSTPIIPADPTATATPTSTPILPADPTATATPTSTPILPSDPTATPTPTSTPILPSDPTATPTPTSTPILPADPTATATPTSTPILPADPTATPTPTSTPIIPADPTATATPTSTPIIPADPTATATPTSTPILPSDPTATPTPTTTPSPVNQQPRLITNTLRIPRGESIFLTLEQLSAIDPDNSNSEIKFFPSNVKFGYFERISQPGVIIVTPQHFTQQEIIDGQIRFVSIGTADVPAYQISVSDGLFTTNPSAAAVTFILVPIPAPSPTPSPIPTLTIKTSPPSNNNVADTAVGISTTAAAVLGCLGIFAYRKIKQAEEIYQSLKKVMDVSLHQPTP